MYLGLDKNTNQVYEGANAPQFPVWPSPVLSQAKLIEAPSDWAEVPKGLTHSPFAWIFREDTFDPVTRIRRGRLYEGIPGSSQPSAWSVHAHPYDHEGVREVAAQRNLTRTLFAYWPCQSFLARPNRGSGAMLAIGHDANISLWRVIQIERLVTDDILITLKSLSAYGIIPDIDYSRVGDDYVQSTSQAVQRVLDSAFRETAISVVDQCRNAATVLLRNWLIAEGAPETFVCKDLGEISRLVNEEPYKKKLAHHAAELIRWLHPRGKANEQEGRGLRISVEEDAELAIHAVGFIIREIGWAKSTPATMPVP